MRTRKRKDRKQSQRQFDIDLLVSGLDAFTGRGDDRFRCSAETRDAKLCEERRKMIHDLGNRLLLDVLAARLEGRFTTEALHAAYKAGTDHLLKLVQESGKKLIVPLLEKWLKVCDARSKDDYRRQIVSFVDFCGGEGKATVAQLTTSNIADWLSSLTDQRSGKAGAPRKSESLDAIQNRRYRAKKRQVRPPRQVSDATRNRHRTAISGFCTYLVNVAGVMSVHPTRNGKLAAKAERAARMPAPMTPAAWKTYCDVIRDDLLAPQASDLVARVLRYTGADVGEVLGYEDSAARWLHGVEVRDLRSGGKLGRIRFKRQKVDTSPERPVPVPSDLMADLRQYIDVHDLGEFDPIFAGVDRSKFEAAHKRARKAAGRPDLRLKDFRHLAAIGWAQGGARLEQIKKWLGHSTIVQTEAYAQFAPDDDFDEPIVARAAALANGPKLVGVA